MMQQIAIIGIGLIGGSIALALKKNNVCQEIIGFDTQPNNLQQAIQLGVIDKKAITLEDCVKDADYIILAVPVKAIEHIFINIAPYLSKHAIITDVGSTKISTIALAKKYLGEAFKQFVPGHPLAGGEHSGVQAAKADLFIGKKVLLTPHQATDPKALNITRSLWQSFQTEVEELSPEIHDEILAATSHLPHILAFLLVEALGTWYPPEQIFAYAGAGFKDFTRIASSNPLMWHDICLDNTDAILNAIEKYQIKLDNIKNILTQKDSKALIELFHHAKSLRDTHCIHS